MMMNRACAGLAVAAILVSACARNQTGPATLAIPSRANAYVTLASEGSTVVAVWAAAADKGSDIYFAASRDGGRDFGAPVRVNDAAGEATPSGEQPPRVVLRGSNVHVLWVAKPGGISAIRTTQSIDGGTTFAPATTITPMGINGARGWESAAIGDNGSVHVAWLDGRAAAPAAGPGQAMHHHHEQGAAPRQDLFHATIAGLQPVSETRVATNVCFCCKTAVVTHGDEVYVAWRHLFDGGVRDIAVARSADAGRNFGAPLRVSADNWRIDACPDDGPAMAFDAHGALHIVWPTLVRDPDRERMAVFHAVSTDGGATFSPRERVDGDRQTNASHPRIAARADGSVAIVWDELTGGTRRIAGRLWTGALAPSIETIADAQASSYPAIAASDAGYVVAWTQQHDADSQVVVRPIW